MNTNVVSPSPVETQPTHWGAAGINTIIENPFEQAPIIAAALAAPMSPQFDVWDAWPLAGVEGQPVVWRGGELWFALTVDRAADPETRHLRSLIHHYHRTGETFVHLGQTLPDEIKPGRCLWSGSALLEDGVVTLFFTSTGRHDDPESGYQQHIFEATTTLGDSDVFGPWSTPLELIYPDSVHYRTTDNKGGEPGKIKAFRDPSHFRDELGNKYILFTGSSAAMPSSHDGVIGLAILEGPSSYRLLAPLIEATGVNNELERPHIVKHDGRLYLFWSTQRGVFAPGIEAPTGLYGATAKSIDGPWEFLNGHGLVLANPIECPTQAYSWYVLPNLSVASFVDYWGPEDSSKPEIESRRARFGGTFAPFLHLSLDGDRARLA